jgi:hypothetical protein
MNQEKELNFDYYKEEHNDLCSQLISISKAFIKEDYDKIENKKKNFISNIQKYIKTVSELSNNIKYIEEYIWISETITFWESYLESILDEFFEYDICDSTEIIEQDKDPIYREALEKIAKTLESKEPENSLILVKCFSNYQIKLFAEQNKRPRRKQRGIATLFLTFHAPQGAGNLPVILLKLNIKGY